MKNLTTLFPLLIFASSVVAQTLNPLFHRQWHLINNGQIDTYREEELILRSQKGVPGIDISWINTQPKNQNTIVAIIDSGIDLEHPDLKNRMVEGKNFLHPESSVQDDTGHGTHVAGIIAANNNSIGVVGLSGDNTDIKIMPLKVLSTATKSFSYQGKLITDYFAEAINFAVDKKVDVINMSVGFPILVITDALNMAIDNAYKNDIPIVVAAGNNNKNIPVFPCSYQKVICVGSIDNNATISEFSNFGSRIDILAPGRSIISTYPTELDSEVLRIKGYETKRGTSQAAPIVSGIIAVMKNLDPTLSINTIKARLFSTAKPIKNEKSSLFGLVDMKKALSSKQIISYYPNLKEVDQQVLKSKDLEFNLKIPIEKLSGNLNSLNFILENNDQLEFKFKTLKIKFINDKATAYIKARLKSLKSDHLIPVKFKLKNSEFEKSFTLNLRLSIDYQIQKYFKAELTNINPDKVARFKGRKTSFLKYVFSADGLLDSPEYFFIKNLDKKEKLATISLLKINNDDYQEKTVGLPITRQIINLIKGDYNLDGIKDYMLLARELDDTNRQVFFIYYLDQNLKPLLGLNSIFKLDPATSSFSVGSDSLLEFDQGKPKFNFIKANIEGIGNLMVPVVSKRGYLPELDNSKDIMDYEFPNLAFRQYLLLPNTSSKTLDQRVLFSVDTLIKLDEKINPSPWDQFNLEGFLPSNSLKTGLLQVLVSYGENLSRKYYILNFESKNQYQIQSLDNFPKNFILTSNSIFYADLINQDKSIAVFFSLFSGYQARSVYLNNDGNYVEQIQNSSGWSDPLMGFIGSHQIKKDHIQWLESRYYVHYYNNDEHLNIEINRESSFPGVEFSESMDSVIINNQGQIDSAVFVNSTLLYGDQLYTILRTADTLKRPVGLTLEIPKNCTYMNPSYNALQSFYSYILLCLNEKNIAEIISIPMQN